MANGAYIGVDGVARKVKAGYVGVDGIANKITKAYIGDENGMAQLLWNAVEPSSWSVSDISGASYKFVLNSNGYYESNNKGVGNSAALCRVNLKITKVCNVIFKCINYAESTYDYGLLGQPDVAMSVSYSDTSTGVQKSFSGSQLANVQTYTYSNVTVGEHFIDVKFRKDSSVNSNNDSLQFTVELQEV